MLNGQKKWIGNASFADLVIIWARDEETDRVLGFVVEKGTPGFSAVDLEDKIALRAVQNALITLDGRPGAGGEPAAGGEQLPRHRERAADDPRRRRLVGGRLLPRRLRARPALRQGAHPVRQADRRASSWCRTCSCGCWATSPPRPRCARGSPSCRTPGRMTDEQASLAKAFCTVRMRETVGWARELMGGNGILLEHNVGRFVADAEAIYSYEGTREVNTLIVGRAITGHERHRLSATVPPARARPRPGSARRARRSG